MFPCHRSHSGGHHLLVKNL
jgi:hypothetical protein